MSATVTLNDKTFQLSIPHEQLIKAISRVGTTMQIKSVLYFLAC